jgi:hypothetical protein
MVEFNKMEIKDIDLSKDQIEAEINSLHERIKYLQSLPQMHLPQTEELSNSEVSFKQIVDSVSYARFFAAQQGVITGDRMGDKFVSNEDYSDTGNLGERNKAYRRDTRTDEKLLEEFPIIKDVYKIKDGKFYLVAYKNDENKLIVAGMGRISKDPVGRIDTSKFEIQFPLDRETEVNLFLENLQNDPHNLQPFLNELFENKIYPETVPSGKILFPRETRPTICPFPIGTNRGLLLEFKDLR